MTEKKRRLSLNAKSALLGYSFLSLWIIGLIIFTIIPIFKSFYYSLSEVRIPASGIETSFVGLDNYIKALTVSRTGFLSIIDFLKGSIFDVLFANVFALIFAMILKSKVRGRTFFRAVFFLPVIIISGPILTEFANAGVLGFQGLESLGLFRTIRSVSSYEFVAMLINGFNSLITLFWFSGVQILVYLTALQKMSTDMYEASSIDGASPWENFWKITLPALKPIILVNAIFTLVILASADGNPVLTNISEAMFDINYGFGFASAVAWMYFLGLLIFVGILVFIFTRGEGRDKSRYDDIIPYVYDRPKTRYESNNDINYDSKSHKVKMVLLGKSGLDGALVKVAKYAILISVSFALLYPLVMMLFSAMKTPQDLVNPNSGLLPSELYFNNFKVAMEVINFWPSLFETIKHALFPAIFQVISTALAGYGLSRFDFKFKSVILFLVAFTFLVPIPVTMIPNYIQFKSLGLLGTEWSMILPALFGQGLRSSIFILIFYQFFNMVPKVLDEAARIDGANSITIFTKVAIPLAVPVILLSFLFSFIWYWSETYTAALYIPDLGTLPLNLASFAESFRNIIQEDPGALPGSGNDLFALNESYYAAGTILSILPLIIMYIFTQRFFVEGIDKAGITGE